MTENARPEEIDLALTATTEGIKALERVAELETTVEQLQTDLKRVFEERDAARREARVASETEAATRAQFGDLKQRLVTAEAANQTMRGYIARVHEDDVVREPLVTVGDPEGEERHVPKRKHFSFPEPSPYSAEQCNEAALGQYRDRRRATRHWITY